MLIIYTSQFKKDYKLAKKQGNYIVFFPSYTYLNMVYERLDDVNFECIIQKNNLSEEEKELFSNYVSAYNEFSSLSISDGFISGFRFGARFTYDTFVK